MTRNQKIKFYSIFVVLALSVWLLWPTFTLIKMSDEEVEALKINDHARYESLLDRSLKLGLDLQGGTYLVLEVDLEDIDAGKHQDTVDQAIKIIRNRVDQFGVSEPEITQEGDNRIVVSLPGLPDVERATRLINTTAQLELKLVAQKGEFFSVLQKVDQVVTSNTTTIPEDEVAEADTTAADGEEAISFLGDDADTEPAAAGTESFASLLKRFVGDGAVFVYKDDVPKVKHYLDLAAVKAVIPQGFEFIWGGQDVTDDDGNLARILYYCSSRVELSGGSLVSADSRPDNNVAGAYKVDFTLDRAGAAQFARVTGANVGRSLAIVLDNQIHSAPTIQDRIGTGMANITGRFTPDEARDLAIVLKAGALPTSMHIEEERTVGPSLGQDSIDKGFRAGLIGFVIVIIFMVIYYRGSGLIATFALLLNLMIVMAAMAYLHATLTLPGIAGLILTIGMAVDANVLIYERIREELRLGKETKVRRTIQAGYEQAFSTILDANVTTLITALVCYIFGTGAIKGFAVTLSLGIIASMYTALLVSRAIFDVIMSKRTIKKLSI
ncbi:MAG: protein translocase subunit SecD [bacterium]|nr:protein translocase subunit SecD [bacterium]